MAKGYPIIDAKGESIHPMTWNYRMIPGNFRPFRIAAAWGRIHPERTGGPANAKAFKSKQAKAQATWKLEKNTPQNQALKK